MTAPTVTSHDCTTLFKDNVAALVSLIKSERWDQMTGEQRSSILHMLKVTTETSYKLSEAVLAEVLGRNPAVKPDEVYGGIWLARSTGERVDAAQESAPTEGERMKAEVKGVAMECQLMKADIAKIAEDMERIKKDTEKLKAKMPDPPTFPPCDPSPKGGFGFGAASPRPTPGPSPFAGNNAPNYTGPFGKPAFG